MNDLWKAVGVSVLTSVVVFFILYFAVGQVMFSPLMPATPTTREINANSCNADGVCEIERAEIENSVSVGDWNMYDRYIMNKEVNYPFMNFIVYNSSDNTDLSFIGLGNGVAVLRARREGLPTNPLLTGEYNEDVGIDLVGKELDNENSGYFQISGDATKVFISSFKSFPGENSFVCVDTDTGLIYPSPLPCNDSS